MSAPLLDDPAAFRAQDPAAALRARALGDAKRLRALANLALRDGCPRPELRAAHARAAVRLVLRHARQLSALCAATQAPASESLCSTIDR